jgi:hypothetical protein
VPYPPSFMPSLVRANSQAAPTLPTASFIINSETPGVGFITASGSPYNGTNPATTPEPASLLLFGSACWACAWLRRRLAARNA